MSNNIRCDQSTNGILFSLLVAHGLKEINVSIELGISSNVL
jgi:hypothetical protein